MVTPMTTTSIVVVLLFSLSSLRGAEIRSFPDRRIGTGEANFLVTTLQAKKWISESDPIDWNHRECH